MNIGPKLFKYLFLECACAYDTEGARREPQGSFRQAETGNKDACTVCQGTGVTNPYHPTGPSRLLHVQMTLMNDSYRLTVLLI